MKEFTSQTGGRFTYVDDFLNLQELALAFGEIFTDCDNFIVSGCEVTGNSISGGLVYLNGKLRIVEAVPSITGGWPQYIYEVNENKNVPYASGGEKIGREIWGTKVGKTVPTTTTELTGAIPKAIQINSNGGLRMKDAWFGKYALLLNPIASSQTVRNLVNFDSVNVNGIVNSKTRYTLSAPGGTGCVYFNGSNLIFEGLFSGGRRLQMVMEGASNSIKLILNETTVATVTSSNVIFSKPISTAQISIGNVKISGQDIYNSSTNADNGNLDINVKGFNGATSYSRTTNIGDGKGNILLSIIGSSKSIKAKGQFTIEDNDKTGIILVASQPKSSNTLMQTVDWQDVNKSTIAVVGYDDNTSTSFALNNKIGDIRITGINCIDLGPVIKEGGVALSDRYALQTNVTSELNKKAAAADVYKKTETYSSTQCDSKFGTKSGGLSQFIVGSNSPEVLCSQIGALRANSLNDYIKKSLYLADIATTEAEKATIRKNIGAAAVADTTTDTQWVNISGTSLYARQIGNIVCIQGFLITTHSGTAFTLPNNIMAPRYAVGYDAPMTDMHYWSCKIAGRSKSCEVTRCSHHGVSVPISITYMT